jgi:ABC-type transport system substrate-binding protein
MLDEAVGGTSERARKLRQAISIAVDFDEYINIFLNGRGVPAQGPLPPGIFGYVNGAQGTNPYVYKWRNNQRIRKSIATAKYLMVAAGYPNGIDPKTGESLILNYDVPATSGPEVSALLGWTREQFAKIGIQLNIRSTEYNRFQEKMRLGQSQIFFWGWVADYPDPENFLFLLYGPNGKVEHNGQNASNYQNPKYDMLFNQMKNLPNGVEREKIIQQMLAIVRRDAPWVWGVNPKDFVLNHRWVMPSKPNVIARNTVKYQTIDPLERATLRGQWNHPILWPLLLLLFFGLLISLPVVVRYWQKERKSIKVIEG